MSISLWWILIFYTLACLVALTECSMCHRNDYDGIHYFYCQNSACCGSYNNQYCCTKTETIVGAVIGCLAFVIIVGSIITCCCCACCPVHQYRTQGTVITTHHPGPNYQTIPDTNPYPPSTAPYPENVGPYTAPPPYQV
ncbi:protein shisa-5-like [Ruditapes philippinarum]|uniref:protein shisa-5-like n=1 Tax=Ruditapes philippinarum TaxID=129788 RepID=UPI00295BBF54|nr:protein shisa-5-like [Ruditapes philippinarum]